MPSISLSQLLHSVADAGSELFRKSSTKKSTSKMLNFWCHELLSVAGEASGITVARQIVNGYASMSDKDKIKFFTSLRSDFDVDPDAILNCATTFYKERDSKSFEMLYREVEPRRQEIFRKINMAPDGISTLVSMRSDLLRLTADEPDLKTVEHDLAHLLTSWFNKGFLTLRRIDWNTPAAILEKVIHYESVHAITGWDDLRQRLAADRMCFAFFHGTMPDEPLIFVEVALVNGTSDSIQPLIDHHRAVLNPVEADTAIFYSINNCHAGLQGIPFGSFLVKQVVLEIRSELPKIKTFATLSPVPKFRRWLSKILNDESNDLIQESDRNVLKALDQPGWFDDENTQQQLQSVLMPLVANYLLKAKSGKKPHDPVARFHLRNGAKLARINWRSDLSLNGLKQSAGILVNYIYDPDDIVKNHENYSISHKIATTPAISRLARKKSGK